MRPIGEVEFEIQKMEKGQAGIQWIIFKEVFVKEYLWHRRDKVNREGVYVVDEILGNEERRQRWIEREKERIEREKKRREIRDRKQDENSEARTEDVTEQQTENGEETEEQ